MKLKGKKAFTLLEMLMILAIISILVTAILLYTKSTKEDARIASVLVFRNSVNDILGAYNTGTWRFEGATINNAGDDSSGHDNDCTIGGNSINGTTRIFEYASSADNSLGKALRIRNKWLNCGESTARPNLFPSENITMEAWAKAETLDNSYRGIITNKIGNNYGINLYMRRNSSGVGEIGSRIGTIQGTSHSNTLVTTSWAPVTGTWYHIVVTYNSKNRKVILYVNGEIEKEQVLPGTRVLAYSSANNYFGVGCNYKNSNTTCNSYFIGIIDEPKVYNESLIFAQVQKNYTEGLERLELAGSK